MKYGDFDVTSNAKKKRIGRGISAGQGKTAGRGTKGQKARTGKKLRPGFMGGQRALMQAVPKRKGFKSLASKPEVVYLDHLNNFSGMIDNFSLYENNLISSPYVRVKVVLRGELTKKVDLKTQFASKSVVEIIEKNGGSFEKVAVPARKKTEKSN